MPTKYMLAEQKPSFYIKRKAAASLLHSVRTATAIGRPLNRHVTIKFWDLGLTPKNGSKFFQQLRERHFQRWSYYSPRGTNKRRNGPPTYAWVIEAPSELVHAHWMVHIEQGQEEAFQAALRKWVLKRSGQLHIPDATIQIDPIENGEGLKLYLAKAIEPHLAQRWRINPIEQGMVFGTRAGTSRNLGPAEWQPRKQAYFERRRRAA